MAAEVTCNGVLWDGLALHVLTRSRMDDSHLPGGAYGLPVVLPSAGVPSRGRGCDGGLVAGVRTA